MSAVPIRHMISEPWLAHVRDILGKLEQADILILSFEGRIRRIEHEQANMRKHLSILVEQLRLQDGLPLGRYTLSADGSYLTKEDGDG